MTRPGGPATRPRRIGKRTLCGATGMCSLLWARVAPPGTRGKGLAAVHTVDLAAKANHAEARFAGVAYYQSAKDQGLMLNVCPWCGGKPGYLLHEGRR